MRFETACGVESVDVWSLDAVSHFEVAGRHVDVSSTKAFCACGFYRTYWIFGTPGLVVWTAFAALSSCVCTLLLGAVNVDQHPTCTPQPAHTMTCFHLHPRRRQ